MRTDNPPSTRPANTEAPEAQARADGRMPSSAGLHDEIRDNIAEALSGFDAASSANRAPVEDPETVAGKVFNILTSRRFCYMGRTRAAAYEKETIRLIARRVKNKEPLSNPNSFLYQSTK